MPDVPVMNEGFYLRNTAGCIYDLGVHNYSQGAQQQNLLYNS